MSPAALEKALADTRQVLADLLQEKLTKVYVVQAEGLHQEVLAVRLSLAAAKDFVELRAGRELDWKHGNSHGSIWWPARDATGTITEHEIHP